MEELKFKYDFGKRILKLIEYACVIFYFFVFAKLQNELSIKIASYVFMTLFAILFISHCVNPKILWDGNVLELKYFFIKKTIDVKNVLWYSKDIPNANSVFCRSKNNLCLFYESKKNFISVKETDDLERILKTRQIPFITEKSTQAKRNETKHDIKTLHLKTDFGLKFFFITANLSQVIYWFWDVRLEGDFIVKIPLVVFAYFLLSDIFATPEFTLDGDVLEIKHLFLKKIIRLRDISWYSKNSVNVYSKFCKSKTNYCLFYESKKIFISVKETEIIDEILLNKNRKPSNNDFSSYKLLAILAFVLWGWIIYDKRNDLFAGLNDYRIFLATGLVYPILMLGQTFVWMIQSFFGKDN